MQCAVASSRHRSTRCSGKNSQEIRKKLRVRKASVAGSKRHAQRTPKSSPHSRRFGPSNFAPDVGPEGNQSPHAGQVASLSSIVQRCPSEKSGVGRIDRCPPPYRLPDSRFVPLLPSLFGVHGLRFGLSRPWCGARLRFRPVIAIFYSGPGFEVQKDGRGVQRGSSIETVDGWVHFSPARLVAVPPLHGRPSPSGWTGSPYQSFLR
jgi:hypothetical protein